MKLNFLYVCVLSVGVGACSTPPEPTQPITAKVAINPHPEYRKITVSKTQKPLIEDKCSDINFQELEDELVIKK